MIQDILTYTIIFGFSVLCSFLIEYKKSSKYWILLLCFFIVGFTDNLLNSITVVYPKMQLIKSHTWNNAVYCNWSPKIYSIVFALLLLIPLKKIITPDEIGLRLRQNKDSIKFSLIVTVCIFLTALIPGLLGNKGVFDTKTLLYLAIMPGLNEELIYRGFLLGFMNKLFDKKFRILRTNFGWGAILTSIAFGLLHGFRLTENYNIEFNNGMNIILTGVYGFVFALMKEKSGSLAFPIIAHSTIDFFHFLFRMI